jgi:membrane dipeptidase
VSTNADHVEHIIGVAGVDHVGNGSDLDGVPILPKGMEDVSCLPALTRELASRGATHDELRKELGQNFLRVFAEVERVSGVTSI